MKMSLRSFVKKSETLRRELKKGLKNKKKGFSKTSSRGTELEEVR